MIGAPVALILEGRAAALGVVRLRELAIDVSRGGALAAVRTARARHGEIGWPGRITPLLFALGVGCGPPAGPGSRATEDPAGSFTLERGLLGDGVTGFAIGDCNDDGRLDLFAAGSEALWIQQPDGGFSRGDAPCCPPGLQPGGTAFFDTDRDGLLDLVSVGGSMVIRRGLGGCAFGEPRMVDVACNAVRVALADVDADGLSDMVLSCSLPGVPPAMLLLAEGDGSFSRLALPAMDVGGPASGDSFAPFAAHVADVDGDGRLDLFALNDTQRSWFAWGVADDPPTFARDPSLSVPIAADDGMAVVPIDFDRDGRLDWFVAATPPGSLLLWNRGGRQLDDVAGSAGLRESRYTAYGSYAFDADLDGWSDLLVLTTGSPELSDRSPGLAHLFLNRHDGTFVDRGDSLLGDLLVAARALTCGDLASDGHVGCVAANPEAPLLLRSGVATAGGWIGLRLVGTVSASEAEGTRVTVDATPPLVLVAGGQGSTWTEHDRRLLLPAGAASTLAVTIDWPSGLQQRAVVGPPGSYVTLTEPAVVTLSSRLVPADGVSAIEVTVSPSLVGASQATIERTGSGDWVGPTTTRADGTLVRSLVAAAPGTARILVALDGVPLRTRPPRPLHRRVKRCRSIARGARGGGGSSGLPEGGGTGREPDSGKAVGIFKFLDSPRARAVRRVASGAAAPGRPPLRRGEPRRLGVSV